MKSTPLSLTAFVTLVAAQQPQAYGYEPPKYVAPPSYGGSSANSTTVSSTTSVPAYYGSSSTTSASTSSTPVSPPAYGGSSSSSSSSSASYACNPAHDYGNGASCISTAGTLSLVYPTTTTLKAYLTASSSATYACNPAHDYGNGASCISTAGTLSLVYPTATATATPTGYGSDKDCYAKYNECRGAPDANFSYCASQYASCLGYNPFSGNGTNTVTPKYSQPDVYTTAVVTQYETYCPQPTTLTTHGKTYTVTSATTLTVCPGNCVVTKTSIPPPVYTTETVSQYTTVCPSPTTITAHGTTIHVTKATTLTLCPGGCTVTSTKPFTPPAYTKPVYSAPSFYPNTTIYVPVPPKTVTTVVSEYTTYCPTPAIITHKSSVYTVTKATTLTLPCPGGCTIETTVVPPKTTVPVVVPTQSTIVVVPPPVYTPQTPKVETTLKSTPIAPTYPADTPVAPTYPAGTTPAPSAPSATRSTASASSSLVQYTGAAEKVMATGLPVAAAAVAAMFF